MKFSIKNFLSKCDQIRKKVLIFCAKSAFFVYFLWLENQIIITTISTYRINIKIRCNFNATLGASCKEYIAMHCSINQSLDSLWQIAWRIDSRTIISVGKVKRWSRLNRLMFYNIRIYEKYLKNALFFVTVNQKIHSKMENETENWININSALKQSPGVVQ